MSSTWFLWHPSHHQQIILWKRLRQLCNGQCQLHRPRDQSVSLNSFSSPCSYTTALCHSCFKSSYWKRLTFSIFSALCDHTGADRHDCNANEAAGVICETREVAAVPSVCNRPGVICLLPGQGDGPAGPTRGHSTRGNVYVGGKPVCDDGWSNNSAAVICRELGWETGWATKESYFGAVHADFGLSHVQCNVQDRRLSACRF